MDFIIANDNTITGNVPVLSGGPGPVTITLQSPAGSAVSPSGAFTYSYNTNYAPTNVTLTRSVSYNPPYYNTLNWTPAPGTDPAQLTGYCAAILNNGSNIFVTNVSGNQSSVVENVNAPAGQGVGIPTVYATLSGGSTSATVTGPQAFFWVSY